jgi:hypothetical protein
MEPQTWYDKNGVEIKEFSVLKMYHFTAALRREKRYMYKWVKKCPIDNRFLVAFHLTDENPDSWFNLSSLTHDDENKISGVEVVQSYK